MAERGPSKGSGIAPEKGAPQPAKENSKSLQPQELKFNTYYILIQRRRNKRRF